MAFVSGASRGIGLALAEQLLRRTPLPVVAAGRSAPGAPGLLALRKEFGDRLSPVAMDITDAPSVAEAAQAAKAATPQLELLVHSAAIMHPSGRGENTVARLEQAAMAEVLSTNVVGPAILTKSLWQLLRSGKTADAPAKVVAVGAGVGSVGTNAAGGWYSYRLSKTALNALMKNLAIEGKRANVAALTLYPQMVDTAFAKPYLKGNPYPELRTPEEVAVRMMELIEGSSMSDSGRFINIWSREDIPW